MIISKKQELETLKKRYAESVRQETREMKLKLAKDSSQLKADRLNELKRLEDLEAQFNRAKVHREMSQKSSVTNVSNRSKEYLDNINELHNKAKALIKRNSLVDNFPKPLPLVESSITSVNRTVDHIRVPILVPHSILRKAHKEKPPTYNHVLRSGEVVSVHLLTESMPTFDPLVRAEAKIPKKGLGQDMNVLADISYSQDYRGRIFKSVSPVKHKRSSMDLSPPEGLHTIREFTPREKVERYNFRDCDHSESTNESTRSWVSQRMKSYAMRIQQACKPKISEKKKLQMELMKEKLRSEKPIHMKRVQLQEIL